MSFLNCFSESPSITIVDIGASPIDGVPPYQKLLDLNKANVIGFEPDATQYQELLKHNDASHLRFFPYAVGNGKSGTLHVCRAPGMTSLFEPDLEVLNKFHGFGEWGEVLEKKRIDTVRLDDIDEISHVDYMKIDVQGSELAVLEGAQEKLKEMLVIHLEVQFVPFYKDQPLFGELDIAMRKAGFYLHKFTPLVSRVFKPVVKDNDPYAGLSQVLWSDAIYVRKFTEFGAMDKEALLKVAFIMHELYASIDLSSLALQYIKPDYQRRYLEWLMQS